MFKKLEEWMIKYEQDRFSQLLLTQELMQEWKQEKISQKCLDVNYSSYHKDKEPVNIPEMRNYCCATISPKWERIIENAVVKDYTSDGGIELVTKEVPVIVDNIQVRGVYYKDYITGGDYSTMRKKYNGLESLLKAYDCSLMDKQWLEGRRTKDDIEAKAHKEMLHQKRMIEQKVKKICGDIIIEVDDSDGSIYVKGSNNRTAHIYAIEAGGYNIQRLHIRVLVKEIKF